MEGSNGYHHVPKRVETPDGPGPTVGVVSQETSPNEDMDFVMRILF